MHKIKRSRARALSKLGDHNSSFDAMWAYLPREVAAALPSSLLAELVDGLWACAQNSRAVAEQEVVENGFVWDVRRNCLREIANAVAAASEAHRGSSESSSQALGLSPMAGNRSNKTRVQPSSKYLDFNF